MRTYKVDNGGPTIELNDDVEVSRIDYKNGEWWIFYSRPGSSGHCRCSPNNKIGSQSALGKFKWD